jgi:DNA-binding CsgD family transcriptional regulator
MEGDERFEHVLQGISLASCEQDITENLRSIRDAYHLANIVYHALRVPGFEQENLLLLTYEKQWVDRYHSLDYFRIDPVVRIGRTGFLPIDWTKVDRDSPEARRFFLEADSYGVGRNGISLPVRGPRGERAIFTVTTNVSEREWLNKRLVCIRDLQIIAHYLHDRAMQIFGFTASPLRAPSTREVQCLQMIVRGHTPKMIAGNLGISESAVRLYLHSIRRKLNCATIAQSVGVALSHNIIAA